VRISVAVARVLFLISVVALGAPAVSSAAETPASRCADCHFANISPDWRFHLSEWDHSAHGRADVGCEGCHGGDPSTFESFLAHRGMLSKGNPASPVHRTNLPKTCGACHPAAFAAFQKSRHYELLREGNLETPTCTTCHGNAGAYLMSPKALAAECAGCHGAGKVAPHSDRPAEGRMRLSDVREIRASLAEARGLVKRVRDTQRRARLELELRDAQATLHEAVLSAHMFVFAPMEERLKIARQRMDLLMEQLANPQPSPGK
jgi:hypothetical protein